MRWFGASEDIVQKNLKKLEKEQEEALALIERHDDELFAPIDPVPIEDLAPDPEPPQGGSGVMYPGKMMMIEDPKRYHHQHNPWPPSNNTCMW